MADREDFALDLGILDTSTLGNIKAVNSFLNDEEPEEEKEESVEEEEEKEEEEASPAPKKKVPESKKKAPEIKKPAAKTADELFEGEQEEEDEEEEKEEEKKEDTEKKEVEEKEESTVPFEGLSKELVNLGVFTQTNDNEPLPKTGEEFLARFEQESQKSASTWLSNFLSRQGEDRADLFQAIFIDGVDPRDYLPVYNNIQTLKGIDLADEKNQQKVYREFYRRQGVSDEKIESRLQRSMDNGFLEEESKDYLEQIVQQDETAAEQQREEKSRRQQADQQEDERYKTSLLSILGEKSKLKDFNGIPINQDTVRKAMDFLYTKKWKSGNGQQYTDFDKFIAETKKPENLEKRIIISLLALNNFDLSKIEKRGVSKETSELFSTLITKKAKTKDKTKSPASTKNWLETL